MAKMDVRFRNAILLPEKFPEIVCLCGSTRFKDAFIDATRDRTLLREIVLSVGMFGHLEGLDMNGATKVALDELHKRKIDLADYVLVLNVDGYIGDSTRGEIEYARSRGIRVAYLEERTATEPVVVAAEKREE